MSMELLTAVLGIALVASIATLIVGIALILRR
jgi:hypothetical protein